MRSVRLFKRCHPHGRICLQVEFRMVINYLRIYAIGIIVNKLALT